MSTAAFQDIARAIREVSGLSLSPAQDYLLATRLGPLLQSRGLKGLDELARRLLTAEGPGLAREIAEATTTNETSFFRDEAPFRHLAQKTLPALDAARPSGVALQVWSAACSSGQEAYSIVMTAAETVPSRRIEVFGTDLSPAMIERARQGRYTAFEVQRGLTERHLARWFTRDGDGWRAKEELLRCCRFRVANLLGDYAGFATFDLVLLRNVLIYFDPPTKERVVNACCRRLARDGVLYLGAAETLIGLKAPLAPVEGWRGAWRLA
jgi:chemotaxis protein methyltransferase CheR